VSLEHSSTLVTHWNAGATFTPSARDAAGHTASTRSDRAGASAIWLLHPRFNLMLEVAWGRTEVVTAPGERNAIRSLFIAPGVRGALDLRSGLQIVPGIGVPIGIGPSRGERRVFLYLSVEHPFADGRERQQ